MGVLAQAKMVTNSFGNRNFMQPMGRLSMHSNALIFFILSFGWEGGGFFQFSFVPKMFPSSSQWVLLGFQYVPQGCSQQHLARIPYALPKVLPLLTYAGGLKAEALHLSIESSIWGASIASTVFCNGPIKFTYCKKKKLDL